MLYTKHSEKRARHSGLVSSHVLGGLFWRRAHVAHAAALKTLDSVSGEEACGFLLCACNICVSVCVCVYVLHITPGSTSYRCFIKEECLGGFYHCV